MSKKDCVCGFEFCDSEAYGYTCANCSNKHNTWHQQWVEEVAIYGFSPTLAEYERIKARYNEPPHMIPNPSAKYCIRCEIQVNVSHHECKAPEGKDWLDLLKELP